jgi:hypothetical protein
MKKFLAVVLLFVSCGSGFGQYANYPESQLNPNVGTDTGATNTMVASSPNCTSTLVVGLFYKVVPLHTNTTTTPTLAFCGAAAKTITKYGTLALVANDYVISVPAVFYYDGTNMELQNPQTLQNAITTLGGTSPIVYTGGNMTCPTCVTGGTFGSGYTIVGNTGQGVTANANAIWAAGGSLSTYDGLSTSGIGVDTLIGTVSDVVSQTASQTTVNLIASTPSAGHYWVSLYIGQHALCTTGTGSVYATVTFTDANATHTAVTIPLTLANGAISSPLGFIDASIPLWSANASAISYTTTYSACATGTASYDLHAILHKVS